MYTCFTLVLAAPSPDLPSVSEVGSFIGLSWSCPSEMERSSFAGSYGDFAFSF